MYGRTRGIDTFKSIEPILEEYNILDKLVSVITDGAPSMIGREKGTVSYIKKIEK